MSTYDLKIIQQLFAQCFRDISILERFDSDNQFFETNDIQQENKRWLVVATGIDPDETHVFFRGNPKRAERALIPLKYRSHCRISILFVLRSFEGNLNSYNPLVLVSPFAPKRGIPYVEIRNAYIRITDIPTNNNQLNNFRWEWDIIQSLNDPHEKWLKNWSVDLGYNPAHPPSHLHLNSSRINQDSQRLVDTFEELRLSIGNPNPLGLILSLGVWLRRL